MTALGSAPVSGTAAAVLREYADWCLAEVADWDEQVHPNRWDNARERAKHARDRADALAAAAAQDTADPADGLSERDCNGYALGASCECKTSADCPLAARQRPARQADTDRAVVEREHHPDCPALYFVDHPERCRCVFMRMLDAAASEPTSGHHHDEAES